MRANLLQTFVLGVVLGIVGCKAPLSSGGSGGARISAMATGGSQGIGGSVTGGSTAASTGATPGAGGGSAGGTGIGTGGSPGTGGNGTGGHTVIATGGTQGTGGSGYGGGTSAGGIPGTGGSSVTSRNPLDLVPLDNGVPGWMVDRTYSKDPNQRAMIATTLVETEALIDGAAQGFFQQPNVPKTFLWQNYLNSTLSAATDGATVSLYIFAMPSVEQAKGLYTAVLQGPNYRIKAGTPEDWQEPTTPPLGTASRIVDTGTQWWINFYKDVFYVEILLSPSYGPPPDYEIGSADAKQAAFRFAQAIAAKI